MVAPTWSEPSASTLPARALTAQDIVEGLLAKGLQFCVPPDNTAGGREGVPGSVAGLYLFPNDRATPCGTAVTESGGRTAVGGHVLGATGPPDGSIHISVFDNSLQAGSAIPPPTDQTVLHVWQDANVLITMSADTPDPVAHEYAQAITSLPGVVRMG